MKIGVVLSARGSAFISAATGPYMNIKNFHVFTDRKCPAEDSCKKMGINYERIEFKNKDHFSESVTQRSNLHGCRVILLMYSRLVGAGLYSSIPTYNLHPSLLPSFPGLDGVLSAHNKSSLFQGATIHKVDDGMDTGEPIMQCVSSVSPTASLDWRYKLSFIQKSILSYSFFFQNLNPVIKSPIDNGPSIKTSKNLIFSPEIHDKHILNYACEMASLIPDNPKAFKYLG